MNINVNESNHSEIFSKDVSQKEKNKDFVSIFDIHSNGIVDEGDFSQKDLLNSSVKSFLSEFLNKDWTKDIENQIADVLNKLNKENFEKDCGKYKIKFDKNIIMITAKGKKAEIQVTKDSSTTKEYLQKLIDVISSFSDEEMEDFINEVNGIKLANDISMGGAGFFDCKVDIIEITTEQDGRAINKNTILHELGHAVSNIHMDSNGNYNANATKYSYENALNKRFGTIDGIYLVLEKLKKEYGNNPCLESKEALFKEYSLYKQGLPTEYGSETLFEKIEQSEDQDEKTLIELLNNPIKKCLETLFSGIQLTDEEIAELSEEEAFNSSCDVCFRPISGLDYLFSRLHEKYGRFGNPKSDEFGDLYCLENINEWSAEYYLYKKEGATHHGSEKLFAEFEKSDDKDIQDLLNIIDAHIKISKKDEKFRKIH